MHVATGFRGVFGDNNGVFLYGFARAARGG